MSIQYQIQGGVLQRTNVKRNVFISKIRMLQRTRMNTIGRRRRRVRMTCRAFPIWLEHLSSSFLSFVRFSDQFSSVSCFSNLNVQYAKLNQLILYHFYAYIFDFVLYFSCLIGCVGWWLCPSPEQTTVEGSSCTSSVTYARGSGYSF